MENRHKLVTIMQQVEKLKLWHQMQQAKLTDKPQSQSRYIIEDQRSLFDSSAYCNETETHSNSDEQNLSQTESVQQNKARFLQKTKNKGVCTDRHVYTIDDEPVPVINKSFQMLLDEKLSRENDENLSSNINRRPKQKFLRKGEGLARFRMKQTDFKLKSKKKCKKSDTSNFKEVLVPSKKPIRKELEFFNADRNTSISNMCSASETSLNIQNGYFNLAGAQKQEIQPPENRNEIQFNSDLCHLSNLQPTSPFTCLKNKYLNKEEQTIQTHKENEELRIFEMLEEQANDSSFCSTSSMITKLMEDSIKSTPIKDNSDNVDIAAEMSHNKVSNEDLLKFKSFFAEILGIQKLDVIDEEPSKLDSTLLDENSVQDKELTHQNNQCKYGDVHNVKDNPKCHNLPFVPDVHNYVPCNSDKFETLCTCSECSCSEDNSHFISASVSLIAEEKTDFSPCKNGSSYVTEHSSNSILFTQNIYSNNKYELKDIGIEVCRSKLNSPKVTPRKAFFNPAYEQQCTGNGSNSESEADDLKLLLTARLEELEKEIEAFKDENSYLNKIRKEYEIEYNKFLTEKEEFLRKIREERSKEVAALSEEKRKLYREKVSFEKYVREVKNRPTKQEREEIKQLKNEIGDLKEEMNRKESRWGAAQARIRTQMKQLEAHNVTLKEEIEKLRKSTTKKVSFAPMQKKRRATSESKECSSISSGSSSNRSQLELKNSTQNTNTNSDNNLVIGIEHTSGEVCSSTDNLPPLLDHEKSMFNFLRSSSYEHRSENDVTQNNIASDLSEAESFDSGLEREKTDISNCMNNVDINDSGVNIIDVENYNRDSDREKIYPDGRTEIWYQNGNVKKTSADGKVIKTIYYNGDVKEVFDNNEIVKYYYAETKTWHTAYKNGFEIIEFVDGQVEKHYKDGTTEINYPNGNLCSISPKGEEKWTYTDGSVVITDKLNHQKVIIFPDGQKETHTIKYKKREYPDGTVKIIHLDGTQETIYVNGRIRLKSKDGTLISDSEMI